MRACFDFFQCQFAQSCCVLAFAFISEPTGNVPLTASSNNESSSRDLSSVEGNERTQAIEAEVSNTPEIQGEKNAEADSTPTENGSDHPVSPIGES